MQRRPAPPEVVIPSSAPIDRRRRPVKPLRLQPRILALFIPPPAQHRIKYRTPTGQKREISPLAVLLRVRTHAPITGR